jgi:hypothetical protein
MFSLAIDSKLRNCDFVRVRIDDVCANRQGSRSSDPRRFRLRPHVSTRQCGRIVHRRVECAGLDSSAYGTHSLRRKKATQIY